MNLKYKSIDKNNMFYYLYILLYTNNKYNKRNKLGIYFDEFNKIFFVDYTKGGSSSVNIKEYKMQLYPKLNVHSIKEIDNLLKFILWNLMTLEI